MARLSYCSIGTSRVEAAKAFYDSLFTLIGAKPFYEHQSGGRVYDIAGDMFAVLGPFDGKSASAGNGSMFGFSFDTREEVAAFYSKALELGGTDDGAPGERSPGAYFAYFRDLDGNKLCAYKLG